MKRYVSFLFAFVACQQQLDLGVSPRSSPATAEQDSSVTDDGIAGPTSSTGSTSGTGSTGGTGHGYYVASVIGAWVRPLATRGAYDRMSFGRDNTWVSTTDPLKNTALAYDVKYAWQGPMHLDWVVGGATTRSEQRLVFAYFWRDERYPYLAWGAYERATGTSGAVGRWEKVWVETSSNGTDTWTSGLDFLSDGSVTSTLSVVGPASTNITLVPGYGNWTCPEADRCVLTFGATSREVHLVEGKLIDIDNDRWQKANVCTTAEPTPWPNAQGCLPVSTVCSLGQSAEWNGCNWSCVEPAACESPSVDTCLFDSDCPSGRTCTRGVVFTVPGGQDQGLCVRPRTLCTMGAANVCPAGESCSDALCPPNTTCQAQCLADR